MGLAKLSLLAVKGLVGGTVVVVFALVGEVVRPRAVAGVSSGAPSVAIGSLSVTAIASGAAAAASQSRGMIAGAAALVMWCLCGLDTFKRFGALRGSLLATLIWFAVAGGLWEVALR
jgi:hypothetical protein